MYGGHGCFINPNYNVYQNTVVSGLYGIYVPLVVGALWPTWAVLVTAQVVLMLLGGPFLYPVPAACSVGVLPWLIMTGDDVPIVVNVLTLVTSLLSDSVLAWRCFAIYGRPRWLGWLLAGALFVVLGSGTFMFAVNLANEDPNILYLLWAAPYLAVNTLRTGFTAARTFQYSKLRVSGQDRSRTRAISCVIIESSHVAWLSVVALFLAVFYRPDDWSADIMRFYVRPTVFANLSTLFGISQALIVARKELSSFVASEELTATVNVLTTDVGLSHEDAGPC